MTLSLRIEKKNGMNSGAVVEIKFIGLQIHRIEGVEREKEDGRWHQDFYTEIISGGF